HRGRLALLRGRSSDAVLLLRGARDEFRRLGNRVEEADAGLFFADALLAAGDRKAAEEALREALHVVPEGARPEPPIRAELPKLRIALADEPERVDALRQLVTRIARGGDQRLLLGARALLGRLLRARGEHEAAFSCFIKVLETIETIWSGITELRQK